MMDYLLRHKTLKEAFFQFKYQESISLPGYTLQKHKFHSQNSQNLPSYAYSDFLNPMHIKDTRVKENVDFDYFIFKPHTQAKPEKVILLFHGFNEKYWTKYLSWAEYLVLTTNQTILLFPIAFHMNRAPETWANPREILPILKRRQKEFPGNKESSFANLAISIRIHAFPERFFCSGLETYLDILQLINQIRSGNHPCISKKAQIHFFGYSIGALLTEILLMANPYNYFEESKAVLFCGGSIISQSNPLSKYIMDSESTEAFKSYYFIKLENQLEQNNWLKGIMDQSGDAGRYFKSMLLPENNQELREKRFNQLSGQILSLNLKKDKVFTAEEVEKTVKGSAKQIPSRFEVYDFNYPYDHIQPFPLQSEYSTEINRAFNFVFSIASDFVKG